MTEQLYTRDLVDAIEVRAEPDGDGRTIDLRVMPWGVTANTPQGPEAFARGAFEGTDPTRVTIESQAHDGALVGRGVSMEERDDGAYLSARIARTQAGDDLLALTSDGVLRDASVAFLPVAHRTENGTTVRTRVDLRRVAVLERGAYRGAEVLAVRNDLEGETVTEPTTALIEAVPDPRLDALMARMDAIGAALETRVDTPAPLTTDGAEGLSNRGEWLQAAVGHLSGDPAATRLLQRAMADNLTTDNPGVVPPAYSRDIIGIIDANRPLLSSLRRVPVPEFGTKLILPKIGQRPLVDEQALEKTEVASRKVTTTTEEYGMETYAGAGDVSYQLIRRSSPSFAALFLDLLAEAYAIKTDDVALTAFMAAATPATTPADFTDPSTWRAEGVTNTLESVRRYPDTIWVGAEALSAILSATSTTGAPIFAAIGPNASGQGTATMRSGIGYFEGLRVVYVPGMVGFSIGWSGAFTWAEEGTFQVSVERPDVLGRDTALYGFLWLAPIYRDAWGGVGTPGGVTKFTLAVPLPLASRAGERSQQRKA